MYLRHLRTLLPSLTLSSSLLPVIVISGRKLKGFYDSPAWSARLQYRQALRIKASEGRDRRQPSPRYH
ncbi:hypothetical protein FOVSG1_010566 [Fusarium oxysporum f. sp. vasinfectum]